MTVCVYFFVFTPKTAYDVRISDWSSDVCSSDLAPATSALRFMRCYSPKYFSDRRLRRRLQLSDVYTGNWHISGNAGRQDLDRKSVVWGKRVSVRVDHGGRRDIKNRNRTRCTYYQKDGFTNLVTRLSYEKR